APGPFHAVQSEPGGPAPDAEAAPGRSVRPRGGRRARPDESRGEEDRGHGGSSVERDDLLLDTDRLEGAGRWVRWRITSGNTCNRISGCTGASRSPTTHRCWMG